MLKGVGSCSNIVLHVIILLFVFCAQASTPVQAKTINVCTVEIPGGMTADNKGPQPLRKFYQKVIKIVTERTEHSFDLMFAPASRCLEMFANKHLDIIWPFMMSENTEVIKKWNYTELPLYSMPIIMGGYYIFTREDAPRLNSVAELEGKLVVSARGYAVPEAMDQNAKINKSLVNNNEQIPPMLIAKRVDAAIIQSGWIPSLKQLGLLDGLHHGEIIDFWGGGFTFQATPEGAALASSFTYAILKLVVDGTYQNIMRDAPYFIPAYRLEGVKEKE